MKFQLLLNILFAFVFSNIFSQTFNSDGTRKPKPKVVIDSIYKINTHLVGGGLELINNQSYYNGHDKTDLTYKFPGYNFFYRYLLQRKKAYLFSFSAGLNYRSGEGVNVIGSNAGSDTKEINFEIYRLNLGASFIMKFGKRKNFGVGSGISYGLFIYNTGTLKFYGDYTTMSYNGEESVTEAVRFGVASFNLEANYRVKINLKHYVVFGIKQAIESLDYFYDGKNFVSYFYLGYNF